MLYNIHIMQPNPIGSFLKFVIGFFVFITLSFSITIAVNTIARGQDAEEQEAAALSAMLKQAK